VKNERNLECETMDCCHVKHRHQQAFCIIENYKADKKARYSTSNRQTFPCVCHVGFMAALHVVVKRLLRSDLRITHARKLENIRKMHAYLSLLKKMECSQEIGPHRTGFEQGQKNHQTAIRFTLNITLYACHVHLRESGKAIFAKDFHLHDNGELNELDRSNQ